MTWKPGDPCPHCGSDEPVRFNSGDPLCSSCWKRVSDKPRQIFEAVQNEDGSFTPTRRIQ